MSLPDDIALRRMTFDAARVEPWRALLSEAEAARYEAFPVEKRKREFLLGRAALRTLLADRLGGAPEAIRVEVTDDGALELPDHPLHVSISHAGDRAVAVASRRPVGVDLERIAERNPDVERFLLHPDEQPLLDTLPMDRPAAFILCWTLKEATLKAMGTGLLRSPKKIRLSIDVETHTARADAWDGSTWALQYERIGAHFLSVAYPAE
mgnify:CR=1 FL=1